MGDNSNNEVSNRTLGLASSEEKHPETKRDIRELIEDTNLPTKLLPHKNFSDQIFSPSKANFSHLRPKFALNKF
jgi:hypothetical protein